MTHLTRLSRIALACLACVLTLAVLGYVTLWYGWHLTAYVVAGGVLVWALRWCWYRAAWVESEQDRMAWENEQALRGRINRAELLRRQRRAS